MEILIIAIRENAFKFRLLLDLRLVCKELLEHMKSVKYDVYNITYIDYRVFKCPNVCNMSDIRLQERYLQLFGTQYINLYKYHPGSTLMRLLLKYGLYEKFNGSEFFDYMVSNNYIHAIKYAIISGIIVINRELIDSIIGSSCLSKLLAYPSLCTIIARRLDTNAIKNIITYINRIDQPYYKKSRDVIMEVLSSR